MGKRLVIVPDNDYGSPDDHSDIPEIIEWESKGFKDGTLMPYGILVLDDEDNILTDCWGFVSDVGYDGSYRNPYFVRNQYLRDSAWSLWNEKD